jgi:gas vesicle protein
MTNDSDNGLVSFLAGLLIGGIIGAGVALLFAPLSGEETRGVIKDKSIELRDRAYDLSDQYSTKVKETASDITTRSKEAIGSAKSALSKPPETPAAE